MKIDTSKHTPDTAEALRIAGPLALADALISGRKILFDLFAAYRTALGNDLRVPFSPELNLPLWELGHIGWFEEYWIGRNRHLTEGLSADQRAIEVSRYASLMPRADALYDSSHVAHVTRWQLALPDAAETENYLNRVRQDTLEKLHGIAAHQTAPDDDPLYFFRLALFHEAMHREAWIYMAQTLGIGLGEVLPIAAPRADQAGAGTLSLAGGSWQLGAAAAGFVFDNELGAHQISLADFEIDCKAVTWQRYLPFVEAGGYTDRGWWSADGWDWLQRHSRGLPRYLRRRGSTWQRQCFGKWTDLDSALPAMHLSMHETQAWCHWAGRRLPSEAEWEMAACTSTAAEFSWGDVWEWTASPFAPYPGFVTHPYRDYSAPWFDGRPVLRGASFATDPGMRHPRYRNFFTPERNDIFAGFRSCALTR